MSIPNPLHPLLPALPEADTFDWDTYWERKAAMASDGQVEEKPASGPPRPIETVKEWSHPPLPDDRRCSRKDDLVYTPTDNYPDPCRTCGDDGFISRGVVERDRETGDIYRRDGKAVPRERT